MKLICSIKDKYQNISVQVRASLWFAFCSILQRGISFITVPVFTRIMSKEQYGYYSTYISWYSILLVFTSMSLYYGVFNNAMIKFKDDRKRYISSMQGLVCILTGIMFLFYLVSMPYANRMLGMTTPLVLMLFAELMVTPALQFWSAYNRFEYKYKNIVAVTLIKSIANPLLGIVLVVFSEDKAVARIISTVIIEVIVCGSIATYQFFKGKCFCVKEYWKYAFCFNLPLIPHYLSGQILNQSDRIMISQMIGNSEVAMYSVAYGIGLFMNIFTQAINGSYTPWFYQNIEKRGYQGIRKITTLISFLMALLVIGLMFLAPEIMTIMASYEYREAVYIIPPIAASVFFTFLYNIFANVEFYFERKYYVMLGSIIAAVTNLILNFIFIKIFGYIAAAYTTLVCYIMYCGMHYIFAMRVCRVNNIPTSIFHIKLLTLLGLVVIAIGISMNLMYQSRTQRYVMILCVAIICMIKREQLKIIFNNIFDEIR